MRIGVTRLGMSLMIVVGFWTSGLSAQEQLFVVPTIPFEPDSHGPPTYNLYVPPPPRPGDHLPRRLLTSHGMGCKDDPYNPVCGSWRYEVRFVFGSCHWFFDQRCDANQPCAARQNSNSKYSPQNGQ